MRLKPQPLRGKYRVLKDTLVKVKDASGLDKIPESILNPGFRILPAGTVLSITKIKETYNYSSIMITIPKTYNKKNLWAEARIHFWSYSQLVDFDVEVEKLP